MGQRARILAQITGFRGWKVADARWEKALCGTIAPVAGYDLPSDARLVLTMKRRWAPRCGVCLAICSASACHERRKTRRWTDLPWAEHPVLRSAPLGALRNTIVGARQVIQACEPIESRHQVNGLLGCRGLDSQHGNSMNNHCGFRLACGSEWLTRVPTLAPLPLRHYAHW